MKQVELERLIELVRLDRRSELVLYCSQFSILPESLGNLTNLTWLSINSCQAINLPTNISNLTNLTYLDTALSLFMKYS